MNTLTSLPSLFVSHGSPMFAVETGSTAPALRAWAASLPSQPRGIVILSPHWMAKTAMVMTNPQPATWHDFGGFPSELYTLQYPVPGSPALAQQVLGLLRAAGIAAQPDAQRAFDHGAWVPLMHLFPQATIPVVQVALPSDHTPASVIALGAALGSLRGDGVLIIGSGSMTHNLEEFFGGPRALHIHTAPYVAEFSQWIADAVQRGDKDALLHYRRQAPRAVQAHPTDEHFVPLYFALGAGGWGESAAVSVNYSSREVMYGVLAMDAFALQ